MASLEARITALEKVVDAVTHRLQWDDLVLIHICVEGDSDGDVYKVWVKDTGGNRQVYGVEQQWVDSLMAEHDFRMDWDGFWRRSDQTVPERLPAALPYIHRVEPVYEMPPEDDQVEDHAPVEDRAPRVEDRAPHVEPVKRRFRTLREWMVRTDAKDAERDDDDPPDPRL